MLLSKSNFQEALERLNMEQIGDEEIDMTTRVRGIENLIKGKITSCLSNLGGGSFCGVSKE
ncbi:hypothetical protein J6590_072586 [Homalodisca vitripennis]|nr:hypothetical protein J6590_072586 [Homalodisca vitripennis]